VTPGRDRLLAELADQMLVEILIVTACACAFGVLASVVVSWASNRSALWNMAFGAVLAFAALAGALIIAFLLTRAAFSN
jgi:hypothetical protein